MGGTELISVDHLGRDAGVLNCGRDGLGDADEHEPEQNATRR